VIIIEIQRYGNSPATFELVVPGPSEAFQLLCILEESKSTRGFKLYQHGFQVKSLKDIFGWGQFEKFVPGLFNWKED